MIVKGKHILKCFGFMLLFEEVWSLSCFTATKHHFYPLAIDREETERWYVHDIVQYFFPIVFAWLFYQREKMSGEERLQFPIAKEVRLLAVYYGASFALYLLNHRAQGKEYLAVAEILVYASWSFWPLPIRNKIKLFFTCLHTKITSTCKKSLKWTYKNKLISFATTWIKGLKRSKKQ